MDSSYVYVKKSSSEKGNVSATDFKKQLYDYLLILDFEAVWNTDEKWPPEIIEFPTVILNVQTLQIEGEFQKFLKPNINTKLNQYCIDVTGIQQEWVDKGISLEETLLQYDTWLRSSGIVTDKQNVPTFAMVTCGDWDLKTMLPTQCQRESIKSPDYLHNFINIKLLFAEFYKTKEKGMAGMLKDLGIELTGRHHSGIDDCRNISKIVKRMIQDGCLIKKTIHDKKKKKRYAKKVDSSSNQEKK